MATAAVAKNDLRQIGCAALDGLLIGEAIRRFAFDDPAVRAIHGAIRWSQKQSALFESIFNDGFYFWPMNLTAGDVASLLYPGTRIVRDEEVDMGAPPPSISSAAELISGCLAEMLALLQARRIIAIDMHNNPVDPSVWRRPKIAIEIQSSDLYESDWAQSAALRRGLRLSLPAALMEIPSGSGAKSITRRPLRTKLPPKREAVINALKRRGISSRAKLEKEQSADLRDEILKEIYKDKKDHTHEKSEALRVMMSRLKDDDFASI